MIRVIIAGVCFALGIFVFFSGVLGLFKFKYVLNRIHATALGDTLGIMLILLGCMILKGVSVVSLKYVLIVVFLFLTGPVTTHLIGAVEVLYHGNPNGEYEKEDKTWNT